MNNITIEFEKFLNDSENPSELNILNTRFRVIFNSLRNKIEEKKINEFEIFSQLQEMFKRRFPLSGINIYNIYQSYLKKIERKKEKLYGEYEDILKNYKREGYQEREERFYEKFEQYINDYSLDYHEIYIPILEKAKEMADNRISSNEKITYIGERLDAYNKEIAQHDAKKRFKKNRKGIKVSGSGGLDENERKFIKNRANRITKALFLSVSAALADMLERIDQNELNIQASYLLKKEEFNNVLKVNLELPQVAHIIGLEISHFEITRNADGSFQLSMCNKDIPNNPFYDYIFSHCNNNLISEIYKEYGLNPLTSVGIESIVNNSNSNESEDANNIELSDEEKEELNNLKLKYHNIELYIKYILVYSALSKAVIFKGDLTKPALVVDDEIKKVSQQMIDCLSDSNAYLPNFYRLIRKSSGFHNFINEVGRQKFDVYYDTNEKKGSLVPIRQENDADDFGYYYEIQYKHIGDPDSFIIFSNRLYTKEEFTKLAVQNTIDITNNNTAVSSSNASQISTDATEIKPIGDFVGQAISRGKRSYFSKKDDGKINNNPINDGEYLKKINSIIDRIQKFDKMQIKTNEDVRDLLKQTYEIENAYKDLIAYLANKNVDKARIIQSLKSINDYYSQCSNMIFLHKMNYVQIITYRGLEGMINAYYDENNLLSINEMSENLSNISSKERYKLNYGNIDTESELVSRRSR